MLSEVAMRPCFTIPKSKVTHGSVVVQRPTVMSQGISTAANSTHAVPTKTSALKSLMLCGGIAAATLRAVRRRARVSRAAYASAPQTYEGAPIGPPPDLPSLLLKERIVYLGTPITNEVTELIVAQLLYLNYESADKPVTLYINSTGSTMKNSTKFVGEQKVGLETDAFAIAD
jgi:hypothetical protein